MNIGRKIAYALLGFLMGAMGGAGAGLCLGLAYTALAGTSSFEGYSGFVVAYWILAGLVVGAISGGLLVPRYVGRKASGG